MHFPSSHNNSEMIRDRTELLWCFMLYISFSITFFRLVTLGDIYPVYILDYFSSSYKIIAIETRSSVLIFFAC